MGLLPAYRGRELFLRAVKSDAQGFISFMKPGKRGLFVGFEGDEGLLQLSESEEREAGAVGVEGVVPECSSDPAEGGFGFSEVIGAGRGEDELPKESGAEPCGEDGSEVLVFGDDVLISESKGEDGSWDGGLPVGFGRSAGRGLLEDEAAGDVVGSEDRLGSDLLFGELLDEVGECLTPLIEGLIGYVGFGVFAGEWLAGEIERVGDPEQVDDAWIVLVGVHEVFQGLPKGLDEGLALGLLVVGREGGSDDGGGSP